MPDPPGYLDRLEWTTLTVRFSAHMLGARNDVLTTDEVWSHEMVLLEQVPPLPPVSHNLYTRGTVWTELMRQRTLPLPSKEETPSNISSAFARKPRPEPGLDCLTSAIFAQRVMFPSCSRENVVDFCLLAPRLTLGCGLRVQKLRVHGVGLRVQCAGCRARG